MVTQNTVRTYKEIRYFVLLKAFAYFDIVKFDFFWAKTYFISYARNMLAATIS